MEHSNTYVLKMSGLERLRIDGHSLTGTPALGVLTALRNLKHLTVQVDALADVCLHIQHIQSLRLLTVIAETSDRDTDLAYISQLCNTNITHLTVVGCHRLLDDEPVRVQNNICLPDSLRSLELQHYGLVAAPALQAMHLTSLSLRNNMISDVGELRHLTQLRNLDLDTNCLNASVDGTDLDGVLPHLVCLTSLRISNNYVSELQVAVVTLRDLDVSYNMLSDVSGMFLQLTQLTRLQMGDNPCLNFSPAGDDLEQLISLVELHMQRCRLYEIPPNLLAGMPRLRVLNLEDNHLACLPSGLLHPFSSIVDCPRVSMSGNPIDPYTMKCLASFMC